MTTAEASEPSRYSRRDALRTVGVTSVVAAAGGASLLRYLSGTAAAAPDTSSGSCATATYTPVVTEGPYWVETKLHRTDIRANSDGTDLQDGVPLSLSMTFVDDSCAPVSGLYVDIWHCNAHGIYSDEQVEGTTGQDWLRGYQVTDSDGTVQFVTIYPGWYTGRTFHIHVRVRTAENSSAATNYTTQIFFEESANSAVMTQYADVDTNQRTTNATDMVFEQEQQAGSIVYASLTGSAAQGYTAALNLRYGGAAPTGTTKDTKVSAKLLDVSCVKKARKRTLTLDWKANESMSAQLVVKLHGAVIEKTAKVGVKSGRHSVTLPIAKSVGHGTGTAHLHLTDAAGNKRELTHHVVIPAA